MALLTEYFSRFIVSRRQQTVVSGTESLLSLASEKYCSEHRYKSGNKKRQPNLYTLRCQPEAEGNDLQDEASNKKYDNCQRRL
jgi:hypothetical protein